MWNLAQDYLPGITKFCVVTVGMNVSVLSWDGGKSAVDQQIEKEKDRKRHWEDVYEEIMDRGKVRNS